jgi:hypothetical protein
MKANKIFIGLPTIRDIGNRNQKQAGSNKEKRSVYKTLLRQLIERMRVRNCWICITKMRRSNLLASFNQSIFRRVALQGKGTFSRSNCSMRIG